MKRKQHSDGEREPRFHVSRLGIALLIVALALGFAAWRMVGDELTRARISTSAAFKVWLVSDVPLADVAFDGGPQVGSFVLAEEKGKPPRIAAKDNTEGLSNSEQKKYIVWRLSGIGYEMLYCTSEGMQANPARVGRRYSALSEQIAATFAPESPGIPVLFAEPVRKPQETCAIIGAPILVLLIALYVIKVRSDG